MNIRDTFINLTRKTYPYTYEEGLVKFLPKGYKLDDDGNYYYKIGESKTIFASHLDTACKEQKDVTHVFDGNIIKTDRKTILGADDKAGVTILLYLIFKKVPGLYYFFIGEECGCIGSGAASRRVEFFSKYDRMVSFDRRGKTSIITHQSSRRTCSDSFADSLSKQYGRYGLSLSKDDTGVYTDSAEFKDVIPECTNISVGYQREHTTDESQDIAFLEDLAEASALVSWETLVTSRDPEKKEYKYSSWDYEGYGYCQYYRDNKKERNRSRHNNRNKFVTDSNRGKSFMDDDYTIIDGKYVAIGSGREGKQFYNDLSNEITPSVIKNIEDVLKIDNVSHVVDETNYYEPLKSMYLDDRISIDELEIIKKQCLDMTDDSDVEFARCMEDVINSGQQFSINDTFN